MKSFKSNWFIVVLIAVFWAAFWHYQSSPPAQAAGYGLGTRDQSVAATAGAGASSGNLASSTAAVYYWSTSRKKVLIFNHPSTGPDYLYVVWNDIASDPSGGTPTAAASLYDVVVEPGGYVASPDGIIVKSVGLYQASGSTKTAGTDFAVRGWD